ncbi:MAG: hypothetical protein K2Y21_06675 [Phycisphaerales bacterium]|nr:hypothetical protein [Phycisphaerales bacterium]
MRHDELTRTKRTGTGISWRTRLLVAMSAALSCALVGCSSAPSSSAALGNAPDASYGGMAAGDGYVPGTRISMAAGDRLGLAVYTTDRAIARREARERDRAAMASAPTE